MFLAPRIAACLSITVLAITVLAVPATAQDTVLVEAESFTDHGGFRLDTQFIDTMGSPYLLAHGLGRPVRPAKTRVKLPGAGRYRVFVRTMDWVARFGAPGQPGRFRLHVDGRPLATEFGTVGKHWHWQPGGVVEVRQPEVELMLEDLTGFDGRCDAIVLTRSTTFRPPEDSAVLPEWRRQLLGLPAAPDTRTGYDLVVVGGGYAGMGAAIAAARLGCKVALLQNRGVLGGNGSSEVRVWSQGLIRRGRFPRIGEIVAEFMDRASKSPGRHEEFGDAGKERIIRAEPNIELFLHHHVYAVERRGPAIASVTALDTRSSARRTFQGRNFVDATGHGTVGALAGADWEMTPKGRMGMSNMWAWAEADAPREFPPTPWALPLTMKDFPYPRDHHGQWFWESGFDKDPIAGAEDIRDWNLRAVFGAFQAMKNGDGADRHRHAYLTWVAYIGGTRESRRLLGDVVLTQDHIVEKHDFPDGCVPSTWSIDLHYPKKQYAAKFPDNPFISIAVHDRRVDRRFGYPIPYRCLYSRNIANLFMAGRCISVTHEALGTVRVMKTCGMMGEVVGKAASICALEDCSPRAVYAQHLPALQKLLRLPGKARAERLGGAIQIPPDALPEATATGPMSGTDPRALRGIVIDDEAAQCTGRWTRGTGLAGYVAFGYRYAPADSGARARFPFRVARTGRYEVWLHYQAHPNRGGTVPVRISGAGDTGVQRIDMRKSPGKAGRISLGVHRFTAAAACHVDLDTDGAGGFVHADAVQIVPVR